MPRPRQTTAAEIKRVIPRKKIVGILRPNLDKIFQENSPGQTIRAIRNLIRTTKPEKPNQVFFFLCQEKFIHTGQWGEIKAEFRRYVQGINIASTFLGREKRKGEPIAESRRVLKERWRAFEEFLRKQGF
ncbi:MAG: hypothetical protein JW772_04100 [Candidatus Diapherotrites archaeon]|nr:hypothetical protein [Candidatus Diapherotrites archaeon]